MELIDVCKQVEKLETKVDNLIKAVATLQGSEGITKLLCKWVIFPLILIVGGLVGLNVALPM